MQKNPNEARKALFIEKSPTEAIRLLTPFMESQSYNSFIQSEKRPFIELVALANEYIQKYDLASEYFLSIGDYYQSGYCQMLKGDLEKAFEHWKNLIKTRSNHWCITLAGLITGHLNSMPTFLQIRNHMEADIIHLIRAKQETLAFNIIKNASILAEINFEAYKFAGRGLFNAGKIKESLPLLMLGQKTLPSDPEIYYHLGQYYNAVGIDKNACLMLKQCLLISPNYTPARSFLESINKKN